MRGETLACNINIGVSEMNSTKRLHEMAFEEFAAAVQACAGVNRWPQHSPEEKEMVSYSVWLSGPHSDAAPAMVREQEFRDVMLKALTEKVGLDPNSYRDNLKVAEIVATRHAYMSTLLEASFGQQLSAEVTAEVTLLADDLRHPFIQQQIAAHRTASRALDPMLDAAEEHCGDSVVLRAAGGTALGAVIAQNERFTVQQVGEREVIAHENARLQNLPQVGAEVAVVYYRGRGQVFDNGTQLEFSSPYVDDKSEDLAIQVLDVESGEKKVVLFNSVVSFVQFSKEYGLEDSVVHQAMDARAARPKKPVQRGLEPIGEPFVDRETGALAINYEWGDQVRTARLGISTGVGKTEPSASLKQALNAAGAQGLGYRDIEVANRSASGRRFGGKIVGETEMHVIQDLGRGAAAIHAKEQLSERVRPGDQMAVVYKDGVGQVAIRERDGRARR